MAYRRNYFVLLLMCIVCHNHGWTWNSPRVGTRGLFNLSQAASRSNLVAQVVAMGVDLPLGADPAVVVVVPLDVHDHHNDDNTVALPDLLVVPGDHVPVGVPRLTLLLEVDAPLEVGVVEVLDVLADAGLGDAGGRNARAGDRQRTDE